MKRGFGPGALVTAAFIGPGTVTTCTLAGARYGLGLAWALALATLAAIVLQDMAVRLGVAGRRGLGEYLRERSAHSPWRWPLRALLLLALLIGNAAFEAGNLAGAVLGAEVLAPRESPATLIGLGLLAALMLLSPGLGWLRGVLTTLVAVMAVAFLGAFVDLGRPLAELPLAPAWPADATLLILALVGTTIVPYNLFLHASLAREVFTRDETHLARRDSVLSIAAGGLISLSIVASAAATLFVAGIEVHDAADMAHQLEPLVGGLAPKLLGIGLLCAGLTSAVTAPLATGLALAELFGLERRGRADRAVALAVLLVGLGVAGFGGAPLPIIVTAQAANGVLLPAIAVVLLLAARSPRLGAARNGRLADLLGALVVALTLALGGRVLAGAAGWL